MCGRYTQFSDPKKVAKLFQLKLKLPPEGLQPRYNAAPTQLLPVVTNEGEREIQFFRWGLIPSWAEDESIGSKMINARAETLAEKPSFRNALKKRRCVVIADGFYEWKKIGKVKQPMRASLKDNNPFAMAGLWESWVNKKTGEVVNTFTVITTEPNEMMKPIHDRMPAILFPQHIDLWLDKDAPTDEVLKLLHPYPDEEMKVEPVSKAVNRAGYDDASILVPDCDEPVEPDDMKLF